MLDLNCYPQYPKSLLDKAKKIRLLVLDVDGVLTNGYITLDNGSAEIKQFHVHDGQGIKLLKKAGVDVAIITARTSKVVARRMAELGVEHVFQGASNKLDIYKNLSEKLNIAPDETAYLGDDLPDLPVIQYVGLGMTVSNAVPLMKQFADWQTITPGGSGAVREIADLILIAKQKLNDIVSTYTEPR